MNKMLGKTNKIKGCSYGCCPTPDKGKRAKRIAVRSAKRAEARRVEREVMA